MEKGMLHLHLTVIVIFLLSFSYKSYLLFTGNAPLLDKVRAKTKVLEMILGTLILLTGIYLLVITKNSQAYMIVKIILVLAAIPLGIIGLKKSNKALTGLSLFLFLYIFGIAQTRDLAFNIGKKAPESPEKEIEDVSKDIPMPNAGSTIVEENKNSVVENGKSLYTKLCIQCHGPEGNLGAGGSKNLIISQLTDAQKEDIITNGKGLMPSFKYQISESEIKKVVEYIDGFKK